MKRFIFFSVLMLSFTTAQAACNLVNIIPSAPDSRYTDNGDSTITDNQTGLMWKQCIEGISNGVGTCDSGIAENVEYTDAISLANSTTFATHSDWRLPNLKELASLVEVACAYPAINSTLFPGTPDTDITISSTIDETNAIRYTWGINFSQGVPQLQSYVTGFVRLVRDL